MQASVMLTCQLHTEKYQCHLRDGSFQEKEFLSLEDLPAMHLQNQKLYIAQQINLSFISFSYQTMVEAN